MVAAQGCWRGEEDCPFADGNWEELSSVSKLSEEEGKIAMQIAYELHEEHHRSYKGSESCQSAGK